MAEATPIGGEVRIEGAVADGLLVAFDDGRRACLVRRGGAGRSGPYPIEGRPFFLAPWEPPTPDPSADPDDPDPAAVDATHPWAGRRVALVAPPPTASGPPTKVLVARVGVLLLVLGLASGRLLAAPRHALVEVDAAEATLACDGVVLRAERVLPRGVGPLRFAVPDRAGRCRLAVGRDPGASRDVSTVPGRVLACAADAEGSLTCSTR